MLCEYAYYESEEPRSKLCCSNEQKLKEDQVFKKRCPLLYFCTISQRYENTDEFIHCTYREKKDE